MSFLFIKRLIPTRIKFLIKHKPPKEDDFNVEHSRIAYIFLAANYSNLGDVLITRAQEEIIRDALPGYRIQCVYPSQVYKYISEISKYKHNDNIYTLIGGGNIGNLYQDMEKLRKLIIEKLEGEKIISFPQTPALIKNKEKFLEDSKKYYNQEQLTIMARDKDSYSLFRSFYEKAHILLCPDIALYLDYKPDKKKKNKIILCMRDDNEKYKHSIKLDSVLYKKYEIECIDTQIDKNDMTKEQAYSELDLLIDCFKEAQLVITDRLHGMLLARITHTPFIAINNKNKKVQRVYETWLGPNDGLVFDGETITHELVQKIIGQYKYEPFGKDKFSKIIKELKK